ncbi:putative squalene monooxygenase [Rosa chinensis]|uniref:Squalene monooxygenase n=1 Tax=Rosa chinensis TaxID=74649 RepID=A0A2P6RPB0_ROSCH|nr:putative squalene monooxygenase [Rosa chinensis]
MPNRSMPANPQPTSGALLIGDAFNMRHACTGGGMTVARSLYNTDSPDQARKEMRQACFDYLCLGGVFSTGPVALLSGLNPRPLSLLFHFFFCSDIWCWQFAPTISFTETHVGWSKIILAHPANISRNFLRYPGVCHTSILLNILNHWISNISNGPRYLKFGILFFFFLRK